MVRRLSEEWSTLVTLNGSHLGHAVKGEEPPMYFQICENGGTQCGVIYMLHETRGTYKKAKCYFLSKVIKAGVGWQLSNVLLLSFPNSNTNTAVFDLRQLPSQSPHTTPVSIVCTCYTTCKCTNWSIQFEIQHLSHLLKSVIMVTKCEASSEEHCLVRLWLKEKRIKNNWKTPCDQCRNCSKRQEDIFVIHLSFILHLAPIITHIITHNWWTRLVLLLFNLSPLVV